MAPPMTVPMIGTTEPIAAPAAPPAHAPAIPPPAAPTPEATAPASPSASPCTTCTPEVARTRGTAALPTNFVAVPAMDLAPDSTPPAPFTAPAPSAATLAAVAPSAATLAALAALAPWTAAGPAADARPPRRPLLRAFRPSRPPPPLPSPLRAPYSRTRAAVAAVAVCPVVRSIFALARPARLNVCPNSRPTNFKPRAPTFSAAIPPAATASVPVKFGKVSAAQLKPSTSEPSGTSTAFSTGSIAVPTMVLRRVRRAVKAFQPVREVFATPAASCIIDACSPMAEVAYFDLSATRPNACSSGSRFSSSGWIAPIDSEPKSVVAIAACSSRGWSRMTFSTFMIVAGALSCMSLARSSESNPSSFHCSFFPLVADLPATSALVKFLKPVPAISFSVPGLSSAAESAAVCSGDKPEAEPTAPNRLTTAAISAAVALKLLPR